MISILSRNADERGQSICRSNKHDFRQIIFNFKVIIVKCTVLFWIKNFKKSSLWITLKYISAYFINFIEHKYRIG